MSWTPPVLDLSVDRYVAWKAWLAKWNDYYIVTELVKKEPAYQCAMLRYTFTDETRNIYDTLNLSENDAKDVAKIIEALEGFAKGIVNETLERHIFNCRVQEDGEMFDDFLTDIKILSKNCNFCGTCHNGLIRDRIVAGVNGDQLRRKLLSEDKLDLKKAENICRSHEKAIEGAATMKEKRSGEINALNFRKSEQNNPRNQRSTFDQQRGNESSTPNIQKRLCKFCCQRHQWGRDFCPAWNKKCNKCLKKNHFSCSGLCKGREAVGNIETDIEEEIDSLFLGAVDGESKNNSFEVSMQTKMGSIDFKVDTGADVTVIAEKELEKLGISKDSLKKTNKKLIGPGGQRLKCLGFTHITFTWGNFKARQICYIIKDLQKNLLGKPTIRELHIITLEKPNELRCDSVDSKNESTLVKEYPEIFSGLGCIKGQPINIKLKEGTIPYHINAPRHIPLPMLDKVKAEILRMEKLGVIRKVDQPTEWCHPIVIVGKPNNKIRLCIDLTKLNLGVRREFYQLESVEESISKLGTNCKVMSKLDANSGYWQAPLNDKSQLLTTFITPIGRYCCTRGPFGLSSMQEIFNKKLDFIIEGLEGVVKSTDDFLVFGKDKAEHDARLRNLLERFKASHVTLNKEKCEFSKSEVEFIGHKVSEEGVKPLSSRIQAISEFKTPTNVTELRRFLGMANQLSKYSTELADAASPLRDLLSTKNDWVWETVHAKAFEKVKNVLAQPPVLAHFSPEKPTKIRTDGSKLNGIAVILLQQQEGVWKPVACASRFLKAAEKNYHPIEVEMLAIAWGCEKMKMFLHGLPNFQIQTDHKPLIPILQTKMLAEMSPRIQNMRLKLLNYSFTVEYCPGKEMIDADALSRAPTQEPTEQDLIAEKDTECHVNAVIQQLPATD